MVGFLAQVGHVPEREGALKMCIFFGFFHSLKIIQFNSQFQTHLILSARAKAHVDCAGLCQVDWRGIRRQRLQ